MRAKKMDQKSETRRGTLGLSWGSVVLVEGICEAKLLVEVREQSL